MEKRILVMLAAFVGFISTGAFAQDKLKVELGYNLSAPVGSLKNDYINNTSFSGFTGEISYAVNPKFSVGISTGYQSYYQKFGRQLYKTAPNETTSAVVTNTLEVTPFLARGTYFPLGGSQSVQPYVSAAAGINFVNYTQYLGEFSEGDASFAIAAQAGAGIAIPLGKVVKQSVFKVGATYNFAAYNRNNLSRLTSIGANAGIVFPLK